MRTRSSLRDFSHFAYFPALKRWTKFGRPLRGRILLHLLFRLYESSRSRGRIRFALGHIFVQAITRLRILLRLLP